MAQYLYQKFCKLYVCFMSNRLANIKHVLLLLLQRMIMMMRYILYEGMYISTVVVNMLTYLCDM